MKSDSFRRVARALLAAAMTGGLLLANALPVAGASPFEGNDIKEIREELRGTGVKVDWKKPAPPTSQGPANRPPKIGDQRVFLALDNNAGQYYLKFFTMRGTSKDAELWVANNLNFPAGDCRNDGVRNVITDQQVAYLLGQFSNNIRPVDTAWFGEPNVRRGDSAPLVGLLNDIGLPTSDNAYRNPAGRDVILVDNVRDDNYIDMNNANTLPYIAGFFSSTITFYTQRNVMTIDSFDWVHRTGANPPHFASEDPCLTTPARPFLYESVFAHEYQHLIHADYDADEVNWVNEGMSDFAEILTGYSDPSLHVDEMGYDSHTQAFLGWLSVAHPEWNSIPDATGPENSLTVWGDQGGLDSAEIFEDYGFAYFFMTYVWSQGYGQDFFTAWHHNPVNSRDGLNATLAAFASADTFDTLLRDAVAAALVDGYIDNGASVSGASAADLSNNATEATIFFSGNAYDTPGAPPYGSDYLPLGAGSGVSTLLFDGAENATVAPGPGWVTDPNGYWTNPDATGLTTYPDNLDASIGHAVTVGAAGATLTFDHYYQTELGWDFGFVQVSTDGGNSWSSLPCPGTTSDHNPDAVAAIANNVPGYTGPSDNPADPGTVGTAAAPVSVSCAVPAGTTHVSFRLMTDPAVTFDGWHVRNVLLNGAAIGPLAEWNTQGFYNPLSFGWIFQLVGINGTVDAFGDVSAASSVVIVRPTLTATNTYTLTGPDQAALAASAQVVAIVTALSPENDQNGTYAPYSLLVNGTQEADGGA